jgi:hypothetical protein
MFIPDPDFFPFRIPDPKTATKERGKKKFCHSFLCSHKFHKIENFFSFEVLRKKFGTIFKELKNFLPKKLSLSSQNYGFGIPDPGGQKGPGSGSATLP